MSRIGVFICHCGTNISATVDVERVAEAAKTLPNVVHVELNKYMCSDPSQDMVREVLKEYQIDRVVMGTCSPRMHELTWRKLLSTTDVNPYMLEVANLREQCSWVHKDRDVATAKAIDLVKMAVAKVDKLQPLHTTQIPVTKRALVIGGGIAGMQVALDIADAGFPVTIVEKKSSLGGNMVMLDKTFPTLDCSACICTPKMSEVGNHPNITVKTLAEVEAMSGYVGNFEVTIREKAKYIDYNLCTGCGACETRCPSKVPNEFDQGMSQRTSIYKLFAQAVPAKPIIDPVHCRKIAEGKCGVCAKVCPTGAIRYDDEDRITTETFGAVIFATGYELIDWTKIYGEYGGGAYPDVITGLQFERLVNASGPTEGHILRPSDGTEPKNVVIVKCVGSRDPHKGVSYCSRACCMYGAKHAHQYLDKVPDGKCYVFYMDVRTPGKGYDEFYMNTLHDGAQYVRGRISKIYQEGGKLICKGEDTLTSSQVTVAADMVVLETAMVPADGIDELAAKFTVGRDADSWLVEAHAKLRPVETNTAGIYLAGTCQGPKDIPASVAQGSAAAAKVMALFAKPKLENDPQISVVDIKRCVDCGKCIKVCPYQAIEEVELRGGIKKAHVIETVCQGCGVCTATCPQGAIQLSHFTDNQILAEVNALCQY